MWSMRRWPDVVAGVANMGADSRTGSAEFVSELHAFFA